MTGPVPEEATPWDCSPDRGKRWSGKGHCLGPLSTSPAGLADGGSGGCEVLEQNYRWRGTLQGVGGRGGPHLEPAQVWGAYFWEKGPKPRVPGASPHLVCPWQGNTVELPEEENTPEKRVDRIFAMMDKVRPLP